MKFCMYSWTVRKYKKGDTEGRPTGTKEVGCELEHGHIGEHRSGQSTSPNIRAREVSADHLTSPNSILRGVHNA